MTTYTTSASSVAGHPSRTKRPYIVSEVVNFSTQTNTIADVFKVLMIPAGTTVMHAGVEIVTAGTGTGTIALSDGTNTYVAAAVVTAAGHMTNAGLGPKLQAAAADLRLTVATAAVNAVVRVWAVLCDVTESRQTTQRVTFA